MRRKVGPFIIGSADCGDRSFTRVYGLPRTKFDRKVVAAAAERACAYLAREGGEVEDAILRMGGNLDPRAANGRDREALRQFAAESFAAILHELRIDWK